MANDRGKRSIFGVPLEDELQLLAATSYSTTEQSGWRAGDAFAIARPAIPARDPSLESGFQSDAGPGAINPSATTTIVVADAQSGGQPAEVTTSAHRAVRAFDPLKANTLPIDPEPVPIDQSKGPVEPPKQHPGIMMPAMPPIPMPIQPPDDSFALETELADSSRITSMTTSESSGAPASSASQTLSSSPGLAAVETAAAELTPAADGLPVDADPPLESVYSYSFMNGPGYWATWMAPSQLAGGGTRFLAPGQLDPNHIDGIGPIWLVSHLSIPFQGAPGILDLNGASIDIDIRASDFDANGARLVWWVVTYLPNGQTTSAFTPIQSTNYAYTGEDLAPQLTNAWQTLTVDFQTSGWEFAGNNQSQQGDWAERYVYLDPLAATTGVSATLHLVLLGDSVDQSPSGFLDIRNITIRTPNPAIPLPGNATTPEQAAGNEDTVINGTLSSAGVPSGATYQAFGTPVGGTVSINPTSGAFTFTPTANYYTEPLYGTPAFFQYRTNDNGTLGAVQTVTVTIHPINDAPVATSIDQSVEIAADTPFSHVLMSGSDIDVDTRLIFEIVGGSATNGSVTLDARTGEFTFTPTAGFTGTASFQYNVTDGITDSPPVTVNFEVLAPGQTPSRLNFDQISNLLVAGQYTLAYHHMLLLANSNGSLNDIAAYHVGTQMQYGNYFSLNAPLAATYLERAVGLLPEANIQLAELYSQGNGVTRDYAMARTLLEGMPSSAEARYRLALLQDLGFGEPGGTPDQVTAVENFLLAAEDGHGLAAFSLGRRYLLGEGVAESADDAYFWLGIAQRFGAASLQPAIGDVITLDKNLAAADLTPARVAELNAAIAAWAPGNVAIVNNAPTPASASENWLVLVDQTLSGCLLAATDSDGNGLTYSLVPNSAQNGTVTIDPETGAYTFTPTAGYQGAASFQYRVNDGWVNSVAKTVSITVMLADVFTAEPSYTLDEPLIRLFYTGDGTFAGTGNSQNNSIYGGAQGDTLNGLGGSDILIGNAGNDTLIGGGGASDYLIGGTDNDTLDMRGSAGAAQGGAGNDVYLVDSALVSITEFDSEGTDEVQTALANYALAGHVEVLRYTGASTFGATGNAQNNKIYGGAQGDTLNGLGGSDILIGNAGNDTLIGGGGASDYLIGGADNDTLDMRGSTGSAQGGTGNDLYLLDSALVSVIEFSGEGTDEVQTTAASQTLANHVETLRYVGAGAFVGNGSAQDNTLFGGALGDTLNGRGGSDILIGNAGNDTLIGGGGANDYLIGGADNDTLDMRGSTGSAQGGTGNDTYIVDSTLVSVTEFEGEGTDEVQTTLSAHSLAGHVENLRYTGSGGFVGNGNAQNNRIYGGAQADSLYGFGGTDILIGNAGNDMLIGGGGANDYLVGGADNDTLDMRGSTGSAQGGTGNDTYIVDNALVSAIEFNGEGTDEVQTALSSLTLANHVETLRYTGSGAFAGNGNALDNTIFGGALGDTLDGRAGSDILIGNAGNDTLIGGGGANDYLIGGADNDTLDMRGSTGSVQGGTGNDTYIVDSTLVSVIEFSGEGTDEVQTLLSSMTLANHVETLRYTGTGTFTGTGNALDNTIIGGAQGDALAGADGADRLIGGVGSDTLTGGNQGDVFDYQAANHAGDTIADFNSAQGDKIDVSVLLDTLGTIGNNAFGNGVLSIVNTTLTGANVTQVMLDTDGSAGSGSATVLATLLGGHALATSNDFIL